MRVIVLISTLMAVCTAIHLQARPAVVQQNTGEPTDKQKKKTGDQKKAADQPDQQQPADAQQKDQPAPLFQGKSNLKSSRQTKDTATAGFNGIGPNGEVDKKMLDASANGDDDAKADAIGNMHFKRSEVDAFVAQGGLKSGGK